MPATTYGGSGGISWLGIQLCFFLFIPLKKNLYEPCSEEEEVQEVEQRLETFPAAQGNQVDGEDEMADEASGVALGMRGEETGGPTLKYLAGIY